RYNLQREEKQRIAEAALELVNERDTILLDEGTTTIELAKRLNRFHSLMVSTNDLYIAMELSALAGINLVVAGGALRRETNTLVGYFTEKIIGEIHADRFFLSADAIDVVHGCMCYNMEQIPVKKGMILSAKETVLLSDHTKFEKTAFINICTFSEIKTIITGREVSREIVTRLGEMGVNVILV
ncbi:MAG: DeoR/GlpR transcriptional regulator, partial [Oscillospiraceae bacterium]|nr:DeoR/GlpR transcriptional regulator [Oscillospiraceae bacterium]